MLWEIFFSFFFWVYKYSYQLQANKKKEDIHTVLNVHIYAMIAHKLLRFYLAQVLSNLIQLIHFMESSLSFTHLIKSTF